jgi:hypothetical protein
LSGKIQRENGQPKRTGQIFTFFRVATTSGAFTNEKTLSKYVAQQVNQQDVPGITKPQL